MNLSVAYFIAGVVLLLAWLLHEMIRALGAPSTQGGGLAFVKALWMLVGSGFIIAAVVVA